MQYACPEAAALPVDSSSKLLPLEFAAVEHSTAGEIKAILWAHPGAAVIHEWSDPEECRRVRWMLELLD